MINIVTQLDKASTTQLQRTYKQLPFKYLVDLLPLLGIFVRWYLLVSLTRSKLSKIFRDHSVRSEQENGFLDTLSPHTGK